MFPLAVLFFKGDIRQFSFSQNLGKTLRFFWNVTPSNEWIFFLCGRPLWKTK